MSTGPQSRLFAWRKPRRLFSGLLTNGAGPYRAEGDDHMQRWMPVLIFLMLLLVCGLYLSASSAGLPERVASHFAADGTPNGYMSRAEYRGFILWFGLGVPSAVAAAIAVLPYLLPGSLNLPNRDYWLAPQRSAQSQAFLSRHGLWLGCLLLLFMCAVHAMVVAANAPATGAPRLGGLPLGMVLGAFGLGLAAWALALMLRFRRPRD